MLVLARWLVAATVLAACAASTSAPVLPRSAPHPLLEQSPDTQREASLDGALVALPVAGKITVLDFWATSCEPCMKMMPAVEALHRDRRGAGVAVVGIAADDNPGLVQERLRELGVTYPNVVDPDGALRGVYRVADLPQTFVLDRTGRLRFVVKGGDAADVTAVRTAVDALLGEPP